MKLPLFTSTLRKFLLSAYIFGFAFLFNPISSFSSINKSFIKHSPSFCSLYAETLPVTVSDTEQEDSDTEEYTVKKEWFIYYKNAKKIISGPFDDVSQAISAWIDNPKIQPKKNYYIGRNGVLYTNNPESYYLRQYAEISAEKSDRKEPLSPKEQKALEKAEKKALKKAEKEAARRKRKGIPDEPPEMTVVQSDSNNLPEINADPQELIISEPIKIQSSTEPKEALPQDAVTTAPAKQEEILLSDKTSEPDYTPWVPEPELFTGSNRYQKKYLSDYVKNDSFSIPKNIKDDGEIDFASEYANEIFQTDSKGTTALMTAVKDSNDWKVKNLISAGAPINAVDKDGWTALMYAVRYQSNLSILNLLLEAGADVKVQNNFSLSALVIAACYNNNPAILKKLLSYYSPSDKEMQRAFVQLISSQTNDTLAQISKAQVFLDFGLPVNSYYEGKTPLMYACKYCKSTKVIKLLLDKDAGIKLRSTEGKSAFDYAQENKSLPKDEVYWALNKK